MQQNPMFEKDAMLDAQVDALYKTVKGKIDWSNPIPICLELAQELENMTQLKGAQRLDILQKTLKYAISDSDLEDDKKSLATVFVDNVLPVVMQAAVLASKSPIVAKIQSSCCPCFSRKK
jgi:hypothetical protein